MSIQAPEGAELAPLPADLGTVAATLTLGEAQERQELARQLKLQVRKGPRQFVRELLGQRRRTLDVLS
jgi:hypothetical protein